MSHIRWIVTVIVVALMAIWLGAPPWAAYLGAMVIYFQTRADR